MQDKCKIDCADSQIQLTFDLLRDVKSINDRI